MKENLSFRELFTIILNNFYIVLFFMIIGFSIGYLYNNSIKNEIYYQSSLLVDLSLISKDNKYIENDDKVIMEDYVELFKNKETIQETLYLLNANISYSDVVDRLIVTLNPEKSIVKVSYMDYNKSFTEKFVLELYNSLTSKMFDTKVNDYNYATKVIIDEIIMNKKSNRYIVSGLILGLIFGITVTYGLYFIKINRKR